jgi:hypothetical protein
MPSISSTPAHLDAEQRQQHVHHASSQRCSAVLLKPLCTDPCCQVKSAEALDADLEAFLWPHGRQGGSGRAWDSLDLAAEAITEFMKVQGC